jgi:hypothetical protein
VLASFVRLVMIAMWRLWKPDQVLGTDAIAGDLQPSSWMWKKRWTKPEKQMSDWIE